MFAYYYFFYSQSVIEFMYNMERCKLKFVYDESAIVISCGSRSAVVVGDLHVGNELHLREKGINADLSTSQMAARIRGIADGFGAERIILLGDIKDTILYPERAELNMLSRFFSLLDGYKLDIVLGNHDAHFTDLFPVRKDQMHRELKLGNVTLLHGNRWPTEDGMMSDYIITAHNHVAISLVDSNKMLYREKAWLLSSINPEEAGKHYKSFNPRAKLIVMPAFNEMITGTPVNDKKLVSISPLIRNGVFDMKSSKVYSIRGEMLGTVEDFPDAPRTGKREGYRKRRVI
ncbi:MAG: metallophosphoesterase [Candidatus Marsarchaeota archaeon]|nr:metallophosphoesterase [Candidatus Marsarchaeota archaeon]